MRGAGFGRRFARNRTALIGAAVLTLIVLLVIFAPLVARYSPNQQNLQDAYLGPSGKHWLGTDEFGRDLLARILYGGRLSLLVSSLAVALGGIVGIPLGALSGYLGGWVDLVLQRIADMMLAFSVLILALTFVSALGVGLLNVVVAVGVGMVPVFMRLVRGNVLSLRGLGFFEAAQLAGASPLFIMRRHIIRNVMTPIIVTGTLGMGVAILAAAGLGFLGLGVVPPTAEWGSMLGDGRQFLFNHPNLTTIPGVAILVTVLAVNLTGDGLRDAFES